MKKKNIFIIAIVLLVLIVGGLIYYEFYGRNGLHELSIEKVINKIENKESFVLCISQTTCSHCKSYKPKLENIGQEYDIKLYYIDIDKYEKDEITKFKKYISFDGSTPVTAFIIEGEETTASNRIFGDSKYNKIINKLKSTGFIK